MSRRGATAATAAAAVLLGFALAHRVRTPASPPPAVWVFLTADAARTVSPPALSPRSLDRRNRHGVGVLPGDHRVPEVLVRRITRAGARVRTVSRWLHAVSVDADPRTVRQLRALPFVAAIRPVERLRTGGGSGAAMRRRSAVAGQTQDSTFYGVNWPALRELGIPLAHANGFTGAGVVVGVVDTGFEPRHESLAGADVVAARDFIGGDATVFDEPGDPGVDQERHGTQVWSLVGANRPGTLVGAAPDAGFLLARVDLEPGDRQADEDRWVAAVEWAESMGADIILSAVFFRSSFIDKPNYPFGILDGDITITTQIADEAARRGVLVVSAMGDEGPSIGTLAAPADADSILAVGASNALGQAALYIGGGSARGPTADGRTKPELIARGIGLMAASSTALDAYDANLAGTGYAAAIVAGGAALFMQAWPSLGAQDARAALLLAADRATAPDNEVGRGRPDVAAAILLPRGITPTGAATVDLQGTFTTIAPTFSWSAPLVQPDVGPVLYRVELATDPVFNSIVQTDTVRQASALMLRRAVRPAQNLWWRVVAEAGGVRRASSVAGPNRMPSWVTLLSPAPGRVTFVNTTRPELSWTPLAAPAPVGPFTYEVQVLSIENGRPLQSVPNLTQSTLRVPQPLVPNVAYRWRVIARTRTGQVDTVESAAQFIITSDTLPPATLLYQNFPNPFPRPDLGHTVTSIWFDLAESAQVELTVHDQRGRLIRRLIPADVSCGPVTRPPGLYGRGVPTTPTDDCFTTVWDGRAEDGETVPRGVYVLRLRAGALVQYRRMIFAPG